MIITIKTSLGNISLSESLLVTIAAITSLLLIVVVKGAEYATGNVIMNATVSHQIAITPSAAMSRGILFGSVTGGTDNNMAENDTTGQGNTTEYNITADSANTDTTDFYHYAPDMDKQGSSPTLLIGNVTHEANTTEFGNNVNMTLTTDGMIKMTTSWAQMGKGNCTTVSAGGNCYIAYWLDVPSGLASGTYNTSYYYCGNASNGATSCS